MNRLQFGYKEGLCPFMWQEPAGRVWQLRVRL